MLLKLKLRVLMEIIPEKCLSCIKLLLGMKVTCLDY